MTALTREKRDLSAVMSETARYQKLARPPDVFSTPFRPIKIPRPAQKQSPLLQAYRHTRRERTISPQPAWVVALQATFQWPRVLMYLPVLVLAVVPFLGSREPATPQEAPVVSAPPSVPRGKLALVTLEGFCGRQGAGFLKPPDQVQAGDVLETEPRTIAVLADAVGNSIRMGPNSRLKIAASVAAPGSAKDQRYTFEGPRGDIQLDFRRAWETRVELGKAYLALTRGIIRITDGPDAKEFEVLAGEATLFTSSGAMHRITTGRKVSLPELLGGP
jgi:hypothetical protein